MPKRVAVRSKLLRGSTKRPITIGDGRLATLLGTPGVAGKSSRYRLTIDAAGIDLAVEGRSTTSGRFSYSTWPAWRAARAPRKQAPWATFGLAAAAALTIVAVGASPYARYLHHEYQPASATGQAGAVALFLSGWALMLLAMMLPTATTLLAAVGRLGHDRVAGRRLQLFAGAGFLSTWIFVGYAFRVGDLLVHSTVDSVDWLAARPHLVVAATLLVGGAFQFTSLKHRCLTACRRRFVYLHRHGGRAGRDACASAWAWGLAASAVAGRSCSSCSEWVLGTSRGCSPSGCDGPSKNTAIGPRVGAPVGALLIAAAAGVALFG